MKKLIFIFLTVLIVACSGEDGGNSNDEDNNNTDTTSPVISLIGSANVTVYEGDNFVDEGATATDNVDGDLTSSITVSGNVDTTIILSVATLCFLSRCEGPNATCSKPSHHSPNQSAPTILIYQVDLKFF